MMVNGVAFNSSGGHFQVQEVHDGRTTRWLVLGTMFGRYMLGAEVVDIDSTSTTVKAYADNRFWKKALPYINEVAAGRAAECPRN